MATCECGATIAEGCQCSAADGDCIQINGAGSAANPFVAVPILDPDGTNLLECGPAGLAAFLPDEIADPPSCEVYRTVSQAIATDTDTILGFNAETFDTDSMHDNATNNSRVTFNTAGVYTFSAHVTWEGNSAGDRKIQLRKNSTLILASLEDSVAASDEFDQSIAVAARKFAAGDYIEVLVRQSSQVSLEILVRADYSPFLRACRIGVG